MWYNAIGGEKQNKKNKAENIPVLSRRLIHFQNLWKDEERILSQLSNHIAMKFETQQTHN